MGKPKIRFKGYEDAWEQRKLGEMIKEYKETVDSDCILPVLTSSKTEGVILQEEHFGRKQQHDITGYNILPRNYCTYRNRSDGVDFTFNINKCCDKGIISKFYPVFSGNNSDVFFISLLLNNSDEIVQEIAYTCTGTGQKVLSFLDLQKMKIKVPNFEEQKKIAAYFDHLDHLITLHQRKCEETKSLKKYMLQKMFPENGKCVPEIRFSGFSDAWEQRKLEEYLGVSKEKNRDESFGKDDVLSVSGEYGIVNQIEFQGRSFAGASVANYGVVEGGDVVYTKSPLKSNPYGIINTARKEVINEEELVKLMAEREDLKFITDIKPDADAEFAKFEGRYFSTPKKMGAQTAEANINAGIAAAKQINAFFSEGCTKYQVNK